MIKKFYLVVASLLVLSLVGCASLQSVSITQIPSDRNNKITASESEFLFLMISANNNFVDKATDKLSSQCQNGKISGILTKYEYTYYFFALFASREIQLSGYCAK